jgi:hypothetical protein
LKFDLDDEGYIENEKYCFHNCLDSSERRIFHCKCDATASSNVLWIKDVCDQKIKLYRNRDQIKPLPAIESPPVLKGPPQLEGPLPGGIFPGFSRPILCFSQRNLEKLCFGLQGLNIRPGAF